MLKETLGIAAGCILVVLISAGCASLQTEIIEDPGPIASITVGRFITANPVDDELIREYLKKELVKQDFPLTESSQYVLQGTIDSSGYYGVIEARITLSKYRKFPDSAQWEYSELIVWNYLNYSEVCDRKKFASKIAKEIAKNVSYR